MKQYREPSSSPIFSYTQESLQLRWEAEVEAVEAGQRVEARDSLVEAAGPVLGEGDVGVRAGGLELLTEGGPRVSGGQEVEREQQGQ